MKFISTQKEKIYGITFNEYTNYKNNVVGDSFQKNYLEVGHFPLITENQIEDMKQWGNGIKTLTYVGELLTNNLIEKNCNWIKLEESSSYPPLGIPVLITYLDINNGKSCSDGIAIYTCNESTGKYEWLWDFDYSLVTVDITHWRHLPVGPKGE